MSTTSSLTSRLASASLDDRVIPPEILQRIFSHCNTRTLATVACTNFTCLELCSKFLYANIVLYDLDKLLGLVRRDALKIVRSERINPYTSIELIHSLSFDVVEAVQTLPLVMSRASVIPLDVLALTLPSPTWGFENPVELRAFLAFFNPRIVLVKVRPNTDPYRPFGDAAVPLFSIGAQRSPSWDRLKTIVLTNAGLSVEGIDGLARVVEECTGDSGRTYPPVQVYFDLTGPMTHKSAVILSDLVQIGDEFAQTDVKIELRVWLTKAQDQERFAKTYGERFVKGRDREKRVVHFDVPSERVTALMEDVKDTLWEELDWAALEEM